MSDPRPPLARRLIPWIVIGAYTLIVVVAGRSVFLIRDSQRATVVGQLETGLQDTVAAWEDELLQTLNGWVEATHSDPGRAAALQNQMRRRAPWFNSLYIWEIQRYGRIGSTDVTVPPRIQFPTAEVPEDREAALSRLCVHRARILAADPRLDPTTVAAAYVQGCRREPLVIRMHASSEAADLLFNRRSYSEALAAIEAAGVPDALTLHAAALDGIPPFRLTIHRIQHAKVLTQLGRTEEALDLLQRIGTEITQLDAPNAEPLLKYVRWPVIPNLQKAGRIVAAGRLEQNLDRADRRVAAYRELDDRIVALAPRPETTELPQFIYDQYSERPFVLYYGWEGPTGVALQLEQDALLADFLRNKSVARLANWMVITDNAGKVVAGDPGRALAITVPFKVILSHLRVGVQEAAIVQLTRGIQGQWMGQLAIVILCALLGLAALLAQMRALGKQTELLQRQRQFTTRVTHELKTPLAGIRVMAENLELGAYRDHAQLVEMAGRIVAESDRLTARVEEVLDAARERSIPEPEPFDPEEAVLEAIDQWGPRLEAVGVSLQADLHPTGEVMGDVASLRDAVGCLLDNALKYRREGADPSVVLLDLTQEGRLVRVAVTDNGIGVPADLRRSIFDKFVRVEGPNRGMAGGYGLGLNQVAQIARAHGGRAFCEEGLDGGARFVIELPASPL